MPTHEATRPASSGSFSRNHTSLASGDIGCISLRAWATGLMDLIPDRADRRMFILAPFLSMVPAFLVFSVIPIGGVFTEDLIETWIAYKMDHEVSQIRLRPHPYEFHLYYDI